ncbi:MAG: GTP cyclohydrolase I FolE [Thermoguttaceae bacterium]|nr:GTP cyclohydrolase I FolE [Thermoguttaceae bacterium]
MSAEEFAGAADGRPEIDRERIKRAVTEILLAIGEDPAREGLLETPRRVADMYAEMFKGLRQNPAEQLQKFFTEEYDSMVIVKNIEFHSMCEHHLLPFVGRAHIGYIPQGRVVGLSKLARVVDIFARRPQLQERMTEGIAGLLMSELNALGVGVVIEATHACMTLRGVKKRDSLCVTSAMKGSFLKNDKTRAEFLRLALRERKC